MNFEQIWNESRGRFTKAGREAIHSAETTDWVEKGINLVLNPSFWDDMAREAVERLQEEIAGVDNLR
jgi:hypothetical protein